MRAGVQTGDRIIKEENNVVHNQKVEILKKMLQKEQERLQLLQEDYSRTSNQRLFKEIQEAKKHIPQLQEQLSKATGSAQDGTVIAPSRPLGDALTVSEAETDPGDGLCRTDGSSGDASRPSSDNADDTQSLVSSPSTRGAPHIIGAEDDDFGTEHEQINGQCSCFQSIELLKSRPAHLAVFLHHVVSQFDPATLLCYLYSDLYKQTNSKETRRVFLEFHQFFLDRAAKRSMGLTLAESELTKLDAERDKDRVTLEKERACAEQIVTKIEEVFSTMQYVILMYMKHLGVKVKEPRNLEHKRGRIGFLPKIKAALQHSLLTIAFCSVGRAMEIQKLRHPKHLSAPSSVSPEPQDPAKLRQSGLANEGTDTGYLPASTISSATSGAALSQEGGKENDT
ncbi:hypothetical protein A6R68_06563, partial [Neotoma lepida]